jgi:3-isopropylmalate/(R)-2-methylmalate dehydratase small subunit
MSYAFQVDPFRRRCLLNGWDDIVLTLRHEDLISQFESRNVPPLSPPSV